MKKLMAVIVVAVFAFSASVFAADQAAPSKSEVKVKTETSGAATTTKTKVNTENLKMNKKVTDTATGEKGKATFTVKNGAIKDLGITWTYNKVGDNYITEYTIADVTNKKMKKEFTQEQLKLITPGTHKITSTSPFTGEDVRNDLRAIIIEDIKNSAK